MKIYEWKVSKLQVTESQKIKTQGNLYANTSLGEKYIPFGGIDKISEISYEKAISELDERATWFKMFSQYPTLFPNTTGFAAHTNKDSAIANSIYEVIERQTFHYLIKLINENKIIEIKHNFNIQQIEKYIIFTKLYETQVGSLWITISFNLSGKLMSIGMGKRKKLHNSIDDAIDENIMISNSIKKYLKKHNNVQTYKSMSQKELLSFINLAKSLKVHKTLNELTKYTNSSFFHKINPVMKKDIISFNVTNYMPNFLSFTKRYIYLSVPIEKEKDIKKFIESR